MDTKELDEIIGTVEAFDRDCSQADYMELDSAWEVIFYCRDKARQMKGRLDPDSCPHGYEISGRGEVCPACNPPAGERRPQLQRIDPSGGD